MLRYLAGVKVQLCGRGVKVAPRKRLHLARELPRTVRRPKVEPKHDIPQLLCHLPRVERRFVRNALGGREQQVQVVLEEGLDEVDTAGNRPTVNVSDYAKAARATGRSHEEEALPFDGKTAPSALIHSTRSTKIFR